jgi:putative acetyltransferase
LKNHTNFNNFSIKKASNTDITSIKGVVFTVLKEYGLNPDEGGKDFDLSDIEKNYFNHNGYFGALTDNNNLLIGTFGLFPISNKTCELRKMYLLKEYRGKGLGNFMLNEAINIAKEKNYNKIILETIEPLKEAISLYKKYGFKEIRPAEINDRVDKAFELILK